MTKILISCVFSLLLCACAATTVDINKSSLSNNCDLSKIHRVAVVGFGKNNGISYNAIIIADKFTAELVDSELFSLLDRNDVDKIFQEIGFQTQSDSAGVLNEDTREKLQAMGADSILTGKLVKYDQSVNSNGFVSYADVHLIAKLIKIDSGEVMWSSEIEERSKSVDDKEAKSAEVLLTNIISKMCIPLKTDKQYKRLFYKALN